MAYYVSPYNIIATTFPWEVNCTFWGPNLWRIPVGFARGQTTDRSYFADDIRDSVALCR